MKKDKPRKAPKVAPPPRDKPNVMKEYDIKQKSKSPMGPMTKKRLSK